MMSERAQNILINNKINTYQQLAGMSWLDCFRWDNCGIGTILEFRELLAGEGLKFKDDDHLQAYLDKNPARFADKKLAASLKKSAPPISEKLTLRDQFAMAALSAIIQGKDIHTTTQAAETAYHMADAMMEARK